MLKEERNMKKGTKIIFGLCASMLLVGCNADTSSTTSSSTTSPSSSTTSIDGHFDKWSDEQIALMKTYCGSTLPYPEGLSVGTLTFKEVEDEYGYKHLEISDEATSFSLKDYYQNLTYYGWNAIETYASGVHQQDSQGSEFVELTNESEDKSVGYDLIYYFSPKQIVDEVEIASKNVILAYNDMSAKGNGESKWSDEEEETIKTTLDASLPFIELGENYNVYNENNNALTMSDFYTVDLSKTYADILAKDGFVLNKKASTQYNSYVLYKSLSDGATIGALIYYYNGNNFTFVYSPKVNQTTSWPSEFAEQIKTLTGFELPTYEAEEGNAYVTYKKGDTYYIQIETSDFWADYDYTETLTALGLKQDSDTYAYVNFEETIAIKVNAITDSSYNQIGFEIAATVTTPTSTFASSWPKDAINKALLDLFNISGLDIPVLSDSDRVNKDMKYTIVGKDDIQESYEYYLHDIRDFPEWYGLSSDPTEEEIEALAKQKAEEEMGLFLVLYDEDFMAYEAYEKALKNAGWYYDYDEYGNTYFEDEKGQLKITLVGIGNTTKINFQKGSGKEHVAAFYFAEEDYFIGTGKTEQTVLVTSMLPYDVTYSVSPSDGLVTIDNDGVVSVSNEASEDATYTITASMNVPGESEARTTTCTIHVTKSVTYDRTTALNAVKNLLSLEGYDSQITKLDTYSYLEVTFPSSFYSVDNVKSEVESYYVVSGFEKVGDWSNGTIEIDGAEYDNVFLDYELEDQVLLAYHIYEKDGNVVLRVMAMDITD